MPENPSYLKRTSEVLMQYSSDIVKNKIPHYKVFPLLEIARMLDDPSTPSHHIRYTKLMGVDSLKEYLRGEDSRTLLHVIEDMAHDMHERGYRSSNIFSITEIMLLGGTSINPDHNSKPSTPMGLVDHTLSLEEVRKARDLQKYYEGVAVYFADVPSESILIPNPKFPRGATVRVSLEELSDEGKVVRLPQLLDANLKPLPTRFSDGYISFLKSKGQTPDSSP